MGLFKGFVEGKTKKMRISLGKAAAFGDPGADADLGAAVRWEEVRERNERVGG